MPQGPHFPSLGFDPLLVERLNRKIRASELWFDFLQSKNYVAGTSGFKIDTDGSTELNELTVVIGDIEAGTWDGSSPADLSGGADAGATAGYYLDTSAGAAQFQTIYAEGGTIRDLTAVDVDIQGDISSSNWDGDDPANLSTVDGTATAGYYIDYSAGAAQFMGDMWLGGTLRSEGAVKIVNANTAENVAYINLAAGSASSAIGFYDGSGNEYFEIVANNTSPAVTIDNGDANQATNITIASTVNSGGNPGNVVLQSNTTSKGLASLTLAGNDTTASAKATLRSDGEIYLQATYIAVEDGSFFRSGTGGDEMMSINDSGVSTDLDNLDYLPNRVYVEPTALTSFTTGSWQVVSGSTTTIFDHVGTDRTVYVYVLGMGRYRETGAVAYEVRLRVGISLDGGSTWTNPGSFAQGWVGTATGGGGYRENMSDQLQVTGTATGDVQMRLEYYVATAPDGLDHMSLYGTVDMNH